MSKTSEALTDEALKKMICASPAERETALHYIFVKSGWREQALSILKGKGVPQPDAEDAVQEALIALDRHVREGGFAEGQSLKNYFVGICKGRVYVHQRSRQRIHTTSDMAGFQINTGQTPETAILETEQKNMVRRLLNLLDHKCRDLLKLYMLSFSMKEIKDELGIKSDEMTRKSAYDCRKKFASLLDENPLIKRYFGDKIEQ